MYTGEGKETVYGWQTVPGKGVKDDSETLEELSGTVDRIVYSNSENGYTVFDLESEDGELVTACGTVYISGEGEKVKLLGRWEVHATWGRQFRVVYFEKKLPVGKASILKYLSSRAIPGVGPKSAERIVEMYGDDTLDIMENHPELLADVPGISQKKANEIGDAFRAQFGMRSVMMFCAEYFGTDTSVRIYNKWGSAAVDKIKENPYKLCDEIYGVGFERADRIARTLGFEQNSLPRLMAGVKYILMSNADNNGHLFIPRERLSEETAAILKCEQSEADIAIDNLEGRGDIICVKYGKRVCCYLRKYREAEEYAAEKLTALDSQAPELDGADVVKMISDAECENGIEYAAMQKRAMLSMTRTGVSVLTGGPGTGKTTVVKAVIRIFERLGYSVALAAPTGRAAKRMSEATGRDAKTIHRMLEMEYTGDDVPRFRRGEDYMLEDDVIVIDETSMVDMLLFAALLQAIKPGARLILIGDSDQLPSVGAGNVLNDIIASDRFSTVVLTEIFRQAKQSRIVTNAHAINAGEMPTLTDKDNDFFFLARKDDAEAAKAVAALCEKRLPKAYGEEIRTEIQIITPTRKGAAGTAALNRSLQEILNPADKKKAERRVGDRVFRVGDKVMQIKNNYDISWTRGSVEGAGVFNGDIGRITEISSRDETLTVNFDERITVYDFPMLGELEHAWAVTIHKSQGSEYPVVIIPTANCSARLLTRELLYTAVTRAQKMVIIVGQEETLYRMVSNSRRPKRYTGLKYLLRGES